MIQALRQKVVVQSNGRIEIVAPELVAGDDAEVIVLIDVPKSQTPQRASLSNLIGAGKGLYGSVKEIDDFIRAERDAWES